MNKLINRRVASFDYISRYTGTPYYYDIYTRKDVMGIGQQMKQDLPYFSYKIKTGDTLDSLALKYYNNPTYWWAIAYFNNIVDPFIDLGRTMSIIKIPNISSIVFDSNTGG